MPSLKSSSVRPLYFKRILLGIFLLFQLGCAVAYLWVVRYQIEKNVANTLQNSVVLQVKMFDRLQELVYSQLNNIGRDSLQYGTDHERLLLEVQKAWLDAVLVLDTTGKIVGQSSTLPLEDLLPEDVFTARSFAGSAAYQQVRELKLMQDTQFILSKNELIGHGAFIFYRAIKDVNGVFLGSAIGVVSNRTMNSALRESEAGGFSLGTEGAIIIFQADNHKLLYFSHAIPIEPGQEYRLNEMGESPFAKMVKYYDSPIFKEPRIGAFKHLNKDRWVMLIGMSPDDYLLNWRIQLLVSLAVFMFMALLQWHLLNFVHSGQLQKASLSYDALHDPLTGLANRRQFDEWSSSAVSPSHRYMQPLTVLALDLDFFKRVNDEYGHDAGDAVLIGVAEALRSVLRECDLAARFGGEEFIVALPQTPLSGALLVAERIRVAIQTLAIYASGKNTALHRQYWRVASEGQAVEAALKEADKALYRAKEAGRNCVIADSTELAEQAAA